MMETSKGEVEAALKAETARRDAAEGRAQELERSTASLSHELEVMTEAGRLAGVFWLGRLLLVSRVRSRTNARLTYFRRYAGQLCRYY